MNQKDIPVDIQAAPLPAEKLLQAVRDTVGVLDDPEPARGKGKGKTKAKGKAAATPSTIEARASARLMRRELGRQENLEKITRKALGALPGLVAKEAVDPDWISRFFGYCQDVAHDKLQTLWAKLLAAEVSRPGSHSLRSLRVISEATRDMTRSDAQLFASFCRFVWVIPGAGMMPVVYDVKDKCFEESGLTPATLGHLASHGLITFNETGSFNLQQVSAVQAFYYGRSHTVSIAEGKRDLHIGRALLTDAGKALAPLAGSAALESYRALVVAQWRAQGWTVAE